MNVLALKRDPSLLLASLVGLLMVTSTSLSASMNNQMAGFEITNQAALDLFVANYYREPRINQVSSAMVFLDNGSEIPIDNLFGGVVGFYGTVFRNSPERISGWISVVEGLSERGQYLFFGALWLANTPRTRGYLESKLVTAHGELKELLQALIQSQPPDIREMVPQNGVEGDMLWGGFLATGDRIYVLNLLKATMQWVGKEGYEPFVKLNMGKWSLAANAQSHRVVRQVLEEQVNAYQGEERETVQEILSKSYLPNGPDLIMEEAKRIINEKQKGGVWLEFNEQ